MTKKRYDISIEEEVMENAKKQIPNISGFVEECLRNYLGMTNGLFNTSNIQQLNETISKCQLEMHMLTQRDNIEEVKLQAEKQEINFAWRQLFTEYRDSKTINQDKLEHASKILNVPPVELSDIIEVCYTFGRDDGVDVTEWLEVKAAYWGND